MNGERLTVFPFLSPGYTKKTHKDKSMNLELTGKGGIITGASRISGATLPVAGVRRKGNY